MKPSTRAICLAGLFLLLGSGSALAQTRVWKGLEYGFTKEADSDWTAAANQDRITDKVWITRGDKKGIFNIAQEPGYKPSPPAGTEWAYGTAANWQSLRFHSWETWNSRIPPNIVGEDAVLHLLDADVYLDIKFTSWTEGAHGGVSQGGGFSYIRSTEGTPGEKVWTGTKITFTKADYADWTSASNQDRINDDVWITRRDIEGIFNIRKEREYRLNPPSGTEWAYGPASSWQSLDFMPWAKLHNKNPSSMVNKDATVHLLDADVYIDIKFTNWDDEASGSGFSYERATEKTAGEKVWSGTKKTFTRQSGADWTQAAAQDRINDDVWITRARWDGIFNIAHESGYQPYPPVGTEWAFGSAADWESLTFHAWEAFHDKDPPSAVDQAAVVHLIEDDIYIDIKFTSWSEDDTGGGFSYIRAQNDPLLIISGPVATPSKVGLDDAFVSFQIVAEDPDDDPLTYDWDFGDGTMGTGAATSHTYTSPGTFTATVVVSDGTVSIPGSVNVQVNNPPVIDTGPTAVPEFGMVGEEIEFSATAHDDDDDPLSWFWRFGDDDEGNTPTVTHTYQAAGDYTVELDVSDGWSLAKGSLDLVVAMPLEIGKFKGKLNFKKANKDSFLMKGELELPEGFEPEGAVLDVDVGGVETMFVLDRKGKAKSEAGKVKVKYRKKSGMWLYQLRLKKGAFAATWEDDGLVNETVKAVPVILDSRIKVGDITYFQAAELSYSGKEGKSGKFK